MSPQHKALLTAGFSALGPDRVTRGLQATGHTWSDCFLALAISGNPDGLARELEKRWRKAHRVSTLLGVRVQVITEIVAAWDHEQGEFRALAAEWLELNHTAVPTGPVVGA
jgi:hypothetical protein